MSTLDVAIGSRGYFDNNKQTSLLDNKKVAFLFAAFCSMVLIMVFTGPASVYTIEQFVTAFKTGGSVSISTWQIVGGIVAAILACWALAKATDRLGKISSPGVGVGMITGVIAVVWYIVANVL